jgi:hypothetical protein
VNSIAEVGHPYWDLPCLPLLPFPFDLPFPFFPLDPLQDEMGWDPPQIGQLWLKLQDWLVHIPE